MLQSQARMVCAVDFEIVDFHVTIWVIIANTDQWQSWKESSECKMQRMDSAPGKSLCI